MQTKTSFRYLRITMLLATVLSGLLAGENVFRYAMEVPGWRHINIEQWGEYSRNADLGAGIFIYPLEAIAGMVLLLVAAIIVGRNKEKYKAAAVYTYCATVFAVAGIVLTFFAAPYMLQLRTMASDPKLLQETFDHFHFWGLWRAVAQILSFCFCVPALGKVFGTQPIY